MTFQEALEDIRSRIEQHGDQLDNEEITKHVLILPMLEAWGYDFRDPSEVRAEYPVKLPHGRRGRADYVVIHNGNPGIVVECKAAHVLMDADIHQQLRDYVAATGAAAGVITDGITYTCYADSEEAGRMDDRPFRVVDLRDLHDGDALALSFLAKDFFAPARLRTSVIPLKENLRRLDEIDAWLNGPPVRDDLYRIGGIADSELREAEVQALLSEFGARMRFWVEDVALRGAADDDGIVTTNDELDAYLIVTGVLHGILPPDRVSFRDARSYASVLVDNNNRKPICRLHFNGRIKYVGTFDQQKQETRHRVDNAEDVVSLARQLRRTARQYAES